MDDKDQRLPRSIAANIGQALADTPVVCLLGPRQSGKTTLVQMLAPERAYISLDENNYFHVAHDDPSGFIDSLPPEVTIDEVQRVPALLPAIKRAVDKDRRPGRFLLTGSANLLLLPKVSESLAGRMEVIQLHPLTESEKERMPGAFLRMLLDGSLKPEIPGINKGEGRYLSERLIAGGYPEPLTRSPDRARQWHRQYLKSIIERDVQDVARIRDGDELARLMELLAYRTANLLNTSGIANALGIHRTTIDHYLSILERLFLVRRLPAWHRNSAKRLVKTPKIHLIDSGLASTLADLQANDWTDKREDMGHLLESFVVQQLIAQAGWTDPDLRFFHYRDKDKVEVDLVITKGRKTWGVEVKASQTVNNKDIKGLVRLAEQCGSDFQGGLILHAGVDSLPVGARPLFLAMPLNKVWTL